MFDALVSVAYWLLDQLDLIWALYAGGSVLGLVIVLWILDHVIDIFDILKR